MDSPGVVTRVAATRAFFEKDSRKVGTEEMMTFWKSLSEDERKELSSSAAQQLGVTLAAS